MRDLSQPYRYQDVEVMSFKQIDRLNAVPKGTTFRLFKRCLKQLQEGQHYFYLDPERDADEVAELRAQGLTYEGTVHAVLITREGYARLRDAQDVDASARGAG